MDFRAAVMDLSDLVMDLTSLVMDLSDLVMDLTVLVMDLSNLVMDLSALVMDFKTRLSAFKTASSSKESSCRQPPSQRAASRAEPVSTSQRSCWGRCLHAAAGAKTGSCQLLVKARSMDEGFGVDACDGFQQ